MLRQHGVFLELDEDEENRMKTIDIDALDPGYQTDPWGRIPKRRRTPAPPAEMVLALRIHTNFGGYRRVGVKPETMLDWRRIERRMHQLDIEWRKVTEAFWSTAADLRPSGMSPEDDLEIGRAHV